MLYINSMGYRLITRFQVVAFLSLPLTTTHPIHSFIHSFIHSSSSPPPSVCNKQPNSLLHSQLIVTISSDVAHPRQRFVSTLLHNLQISHLQSRGRVIRDFKVHCDGTHLVIVLLLHQSPSPFAPTPSSRCTDGRPKWARIWYSRMP